MVINGVEDQPMTKVPRDNTSAIWPGVEGGRYRPLSTRDMQRIHETALEVLATIGIADPTSEVQEMALRAGCTLDNDGRLLFPKSLIEDVLSGAAREVHMYARDPQHDIRLGGKGVHYATNGEAILMLDMETKDYRPSTLLDLYDSARLSDKLENIHRFGQTVVATEILDPFTCDMNIAFAMMSATQKPFGVSLMRAEDIAPVVSMFDMVLGAEGEFAKRPFCSIGCNPIISPLRFAEESLKILVEATRHGSHGSVTTSGQAGSTAPTALAGAVVQSVAEMLAIVAVVNFVKPGHPVNFAAWPFVTDLRTGNFSGGSGEQALLSAACAQISNEFYRLPSSVGAGMTDSKLPDAQAGFEKGVTVALSALAGANCISEAAGMMGSLLGFSLEGLVIDNDMLGMIQRTVRGIEVTEETLSLEVIRDTILGDGHFLVHPQTLELMRSEYVYPKILDRKSTRSWEQAGAPEIRARAAEEVRDILSTHYPTYIDPAIEEKIRDRFPILLEKGHMKPGNERW